MRTHTCYLRALFVGFALVALLACEPNTPRQPAVRAPELATEVVRARTLVEETGWDGVVEAIDRATVSAQTSGRVAELSVDVDSRVNRGDALVRLTDVEQSAALRQAEARVRIAVAALGDAETDYRRIARLIERKLVAQAQFDAARTRRAAARAERDSAGAALAAAAEQLDYTIVRAPYSGVVTERHVEVGEAVQPGQPLVSGFDAGRWRVLVVVPEGVARGLGDGTATILLPVAATTRIPTRIAAERVTVFPRADANSHAVTLRVEAPANAPRVSPGSTVRVAFPLTSTQRLTVPVTAVVRRSELSAVYVLTARGISLRQVRLGESRGARVVIHAGLRAGERVVVSAARARSHLAAQVDEAAR